MDKNELLRATLESGIEPIEIKFVPVMSTSTRQTFAYRTVMQLNTQSLGVLLPADYETVASRTVQCVNLALSNITDISETISLAASRGAKADWFSAACPVRMLTKGSAAKLLSEHFSEIGFTNHTKLCLEFPSQILFEDREKAAYELNALRFMGIKTALAGYGDEYCPTLRLAGFPFDYVILDRSVTEKMAAPDSSKSTSAMIAYIRGLGINVIANGASGNDIVSEFYRADCTGYIPEPDRLLSRDEALADRNKR
jgi:EAL domain-containing protein (putative c-di-GMP-specific phosphodiesterase class I)